MGVKKIPAEIGQLKKLQTLHLTGTFVSELPTEIRQLIQLNKLYLSGNSKLNLPDAFKTIAPLSNLVVLHIIGQRVRQLPTTITQLQSLRTIFILEKEDTLGKLGKAKALFHLHLHGNNIDAISKEIAVFSNLKDTLTVTFCKPYRLKWVLCKGYKY